jgi:outer membrane immunogenic protein
MKRMFIGVAAVVSLLGAPAMAADLAPRVYTKAPPPVALYDWTGFYVGVNGGYGWGRASDTFTTALPAFSASQNMNGWVFGGQAGYNWEFNRNWVLGIEGDVEATGQRGTATLGPNSVVTVFTPPLGALVLPTITTTTTTTGSLEEKLPWLGTLRGRIGFLPTDRVLLYATGGLAVGEVKTTGSATVATSSVASFGVAPGPTGATVLASSSTTRAGWTVGAGVEGAIAGNWTAKLEYLYVDLGTINNTFTGVGAFAPFTTSAHVTDNIVRAGVNYKFGGPIVARY